MRNRELFLKQAVTKIWEFCLSQSLKTFPCIPEANTRIQVPTTSIAFHVWSSLYVPKFGINQTTTPPDASPPHL